MTVYGADAVHAAATGEARLRIGPRDVVTPLAREVAAELGVEIVVTAPEHPPGRSPGRTAGVPGSPAATGTSTARGGTIQTPPPAGRQRPAVPPAPPQLRREQPATPPQWKREQPAIALTPPQPRRERPASGEGAARTASPVAPPRPGRPVVPAAAPPLPWPPSPALYRRGAPTAFDVPGPSAGAGDCGCGRVGRVVVVGAGHVGTITAMRLAEADLIDEVVLVDIAEGLAAGIALDITHTAALLGFTTRLRGTVTIEDAGPADYVVITAGRPRQPGMSRTDLTAVNAAIVGELARRAAATSPEAVLVVVTNPLDEMTHHAWVASGFPARRVIGMAGVLDAARFRALIGLRGIDRAGRVSALALGSHGDEMVIPLSRARAAGTPLGDRLPAAELEAIVNRTRDSGAEVVGLLKSGSAFLAPGTSTAHLVLAMARGSGEIVPATVRAEGQYGIRDVFVGLPVRLGRHGVSEIVELDLSSGELAALRSAANRIAERVAGLPRPDEAAQRATTPPRADGSAGRTAVLSRPDRAAGRVAGAGEAVVGRS